LIKDTACIEGDHKVSSLSEWPSKLREGDKLDKVIEVRYPFLNELSVESKVEGMLSALVTFDFPLAMLSLEMESSEHDTADA
jgi:hypothetical protein